MSRLIDRLPTPEKVKEKKLIVFSRSRVGTFSLYRALKMLGYTPYHIYEVVKNGITHLDLFDEALRCKYQGTGKPYGKAEFDKWMANYDALIEIPQFFVEEFLEFYPNAKFMLVERDVNAWERSINKTIADMLKTCKSFPLNTLQYVDPFIKSFVTFHDAFGEALFHGRGVQGGMEDAKRHMISDGEMIRRVAPKDQLLTCTLEGGFGWEEICPFLDKDIPETPYPIGNAPEEFKVLGERILAPRVRNSILKIFGAALVPVIGIGMWSYARR
ncbi:hypothetical protein V8C37DRAFT_77313 [Trichoderma ceciliae]